MEERFVDFDTVDRFVKQTQGRERRSQAVGSQMELAWFGDLQFVGADGRRKFKAETLQPDLVAGPLREFGLQPVFETCGFDGKDQRESDNEACREQEAQQLQTGTRKNGHRKTIHVETRCSNRQLNLPRQQSALSRTRLFARTLSDFTIDFRFGRSISSAWNCPADTID